MTIVINLWTDPEADLPSHLARFSEWSPALSFIHQQVSQGHQCSVEMVDQPLITDDMRGRLH